MNVQTACTVSLTVPEDMEPPVYVYYELENFYQNHRRYVKSRDDVQLREGKLLTASDLSDCEPLIQSQNGTKSPIRHPCGLIAGSFFNGMCARSRACLVPWLRMYFAAVAPLHTLPPLA